LAGFFDFLQMVVKFVITQRACSCRQSVLLLRTSDTFLSCDALQPQLMNG